MPCKGTETPSRAAYRALRRALRLTALFTSDFGTTTERAPGGEEPRNLREPKRSSTLWEDFRTSSNKTLLSRRPLGNIGLDRKALAPDAAPAAQHTLPIRAFVPPEKPVGFCPF